MNSHSRILEITCDEELLLPAINKRVREMRVEIHQLKALREEIREAVGEKACLIQLLREGAIRGEPCQEIRRKY